MGPEQPLAPPPGMGMPPQGLADAMRRYMNPEPPQGQQQGGMSKFLMGRSKPPEPPDWAKPDWHDNLGKNNPYSQLAPEIVGPEAQGRTPHYNPFGGGLTEHGFGAGRVEHPPLKRQPLIPGVDILEPNPMLPPSPKISRGFR